MKLRMVAPVWRPAPVDVEPEVVLESWRIMQVADGGMHFLGRNALNGHGRVSSEVIAFDPALLLGQTRSGRIYRLVGSSGLDANADYVWAIWCSRNNVRAYRDISQTYLNECCAQFTQAESR
jgi:hypothetical protein